MIFPESKSVLSIEREGRIKQTFHRVTTHKACNSTGQNFVVDEA